MLERLVRMEKQVPLCHNVQLTSHTRQWQHLRLTKAIRPHFWRLQCCLLVNLRYRCRRVFIKLPNLTHLPPAAHSEKVMQRAAGRKVCERVCAYAHVRACACGRARACACVCCVLCVVRSFGCLFVCVNVCVTVVVSRFWVSFDILRPRRLHKVAQSSHLLLRVHEQFISQKRATSMRNSSRSSTSMPTARKTVETSTTWRRIKTRNGRHSTDNCLHGKCVDETLPTSGTLVGFADVTVKPRTSRLPCALTWQHTHWRTNDPCVCGIKSNRSGIKGFNSSGIQDET